MAAFAYQALDANGRRKEGMIEADSPRQARQLLREQGLTPVELTVTGNNGDRTTGNTTGHDAGKLSI